jgi:hypothetical protein
MSGTAADRLAIRDLVENWAVWRDSGDWERFRTVWHPDGRMMATWFQGPAEEFIRVSREGFARGVRILHFLGGTSIDLAGDRAIAQTKMTISQRAVVQDVLCDVVCTGRFYDFLERRDERWGSCCASRSTRRTGWIPSTRPPGSSSPPRRSSGSRKVTATWPTCRPALATTSSPTCPVWPGPRSTPSTSGEAGGWPAARATDAAGPRSAGTVQPVSAW